MLTTRQPDAPFFKVRLESLFRVLTDILKYRNTNLCGSLLHLLQLNITTETRNSHIITHTLSGPSSVLVTFRQIYKPQCQTLWARRFLQCNTEVTVTCLSTCLPTCCTDPGTCLTSQHHAHQVCPSSVYTVKQWCCQKQQPADCNLLSHNTMLYRHEGEKQTETESDTKTETSVSECVKSCFIWYLFFTLP